MIDTLSDVLIRLSVKGTLYFRTAFTAPWGVAVPAYQNVARFHFAHRGDCKLRLPATGETILLAQGDLVIIPHGAAHDLYCGHDPDSTILPLDRVLELSGYKDEGVLVYGGEEDERETQLICGHFSFAPGARHPIFNRLPTLIHIENYGEAAGRWMEASLRLIGDEAGKSRFGGDLIALKMSEVIFAQAIRTFVERDGAGHIGLAGFADPKISRALTAFHGDPAKDWSIESLAREAGLSRTGFAVQFSDKMGMTPMQYLTGWRMQIARQKLTEDAGSISEIAALSGYSSESAFARVFKKEMGVTPAAFRSSKAKKSQPSVH